MPRKPQREECHRDRRYLDWTPQLCVSVYQFFSLLTNMRLANNMRFKGASGLGKAFVHRFVEAGAYVTFGDVNEEAGFKLAAELAGYVIEPYMLQDLSQTWDNPSLPPTRPDTTIFDVNLTGTIYTAKLAIHYFRRQSLEPDRDRCLILIGSIAGYLDLPGSATYSMSKFGECLGRFDSSQFSFTKGVKFASESDACNAILRIASDTTVNGRSIAVVSKEDCAGGYFDLAEDDFPEGSKLYDLQNVAINVGSRT
ncbi:short chain dehydrogenase/reductase [Histoplasma capsulatum]|uniref:Short chain dehydrogenase/reductase n=1 Tax=Ajellomyces capsulatus TaxID=5037 RepID=A0A8A1M2Y7_AJECA|nr:short chain dehydrogenase/reductase [Histoplasma capsulatum]